jgi:hypothetical protein
MKMKVQDIIESLKQGKLECGTYGEGIYAQIQNHGGKETTILDSSRASTKEYSAAWGRIWNGEQHLKSFEGPINVVRADMVRYLQAMEPESVRF